MAHFTVGIFGGCHVEGFGVGADYAFGSQLAALLARSAQDAHIVTVPYVKYRDAEAVLRDIRARSVDIAVLQIGNYEASWAQFVSRLSRNSIARKCGLARLLALVSDGSSSSSSLATLSDTGRTESFCRTASYFARHSVIKQIIDMMFGHLFVDYAVMQREMQNCLDTLRAEFDGITIVLTPFPHMDPANRKHRRRAGILLTQECLSRGTPVVDTFAIVDAPRYFLPDGAHLNVHGHEALARALMGAMAIRCRRMAI